MSGARRPGGQSPAPGLAGTGRLADDLYLLAHHELTGRPFVQPRALGLGLAGALLAETLLDGGLTVWPGGDLTAGDRVPGEELARRVRHLVASEPRAHPVRDWLLYLARTSAGEVAARLAGAGYLARSGGRWRPGRWVPVDPDWAFAPLLRARAALDQARPPFTEGAALAGLACACGLGFRLAQYAPPAPGRTAGDAVAHLDPGLSELIAQTQAAVDSAVLAHRT